MKPKALALMERHPFVAGFDTKDIVYSRKQLLIQKLKILKTKKLLRGKVEQLFTTK